jgi:Cd2+/Zn2+-exporting ATPase
MDADTFFKIAAYAVSRSFAPCARAIIDAYGARIDDSLISDFAERPGWGVSVRVDRMRILLGTQAFFALGNIRLEGAVPGGNTLYMVIEGQLAGRIVLARPVFSEAAGTLERLRREGAERLVMISGDSRQTDSRVAQSLGIDEYISECSQQDAARYIEQLRAKLGAQNVIALVHGGAVQSLAAERADVVFEVGARDARARDKSADVLIPEPSIEQLPEALLSARRARTLARGFVFGAFGRKLVLAGLALAGVCPLWFGVTIDSAATLALILGVFWLF